VRRRRGVNSGTSFSHVIRGGLVGHVVVPGYPQCPLGKPFALAEVLKIVRRSGPWGQPPADLTLFLQRDTASQLPSQTQTITFDAKSCLAHQGHPCVETAVAVLLGLPKLSPPLSLLAREILMHTVKRALLDCGSLARDAGMSHMRPTKSSTTRR